MDNALHFFDELKKGMQQVEQAIEDWDYQDFSPDKRRALLDEQIVADVADDLKPEVDAIHQIQAVRSRADWSGLSPDDELADFSFGSDEAAAVAHAATYESKVVIMSTPGGGIQGVPDTDVLHRFVAKVPQMNPQALVQALTARLLDAVASWHVRSKTLVLVHALIETAQLAPQYLPIMVQHAALLQRLEQLRVHGYNHMVREHARKALSLIHSNGTNAMLLAKEPGAKSPRRQQVDRSPANSSDSTSTLASVRTARVVRSASPSSKSSAPIDVDAQRRLKQLTTTRKSGADAPPVIQSPTIARAALASWRRRNSENATVDDRTNANAMPIKTSPLKPEAVPEISMAKRQIDSGNIVDASRHGSSQRSSAFTSSQ